MATPAIESLAHAGLAEILSCHALFNRTSGREGRMADLSLYRIFDFDFTDLDLSSVAAQCTQFVRCRFVNADLSDMNFDRTSATDCDFRAANLVKARFYKADVSNSSFDDAKLGSSEFTDTNASGARFLRADLSGAIFENCNLSNALFDGAELGGADFRRNREVGEVGRR